jgi:uncharacterized protein (TIGR03083 family)
MSDLTPAFYLEHLRADSDAFLAAVREGSQPPLPQVSGCPDWNLADLLIHLGYVHRLQGNRVRARVREFVQYSPEEWERVTELPPQFLAWVDEGSPSDVAIPQELLSWYDAGAALLLDTLENVSPGDQIGTWFPPDQTAGFWQRRMAHETAVHRWDAQSAVGREEPIDAALARDGIDEMVDVQIPMFRVWEIPRAGSGESYHFHTTDTDGEWLVRFDGEEARVTREHAKADVAVRGTASDLLLFLWGRLPADRLEVFGDRELLVRYRELVPPG